MSGASYDSDRSRPLGSEHSRSDHGDHAFFDLHWLARLGDENIVLEDGAASAFIGHFQVGGIRNT